MTENIAMGENKKIYTKEDVDWAFHIWKKHDTEAKDAWKSYLEIKDIYDTLNQKDIDWDNYFIKTVEEGEEVYDGFIAKWSATYLVTTNDTEIKAYVLKGSKRRKYEGGSVRYFE